MSEPTKYPKINFSYASRNSIPLEVSFVFEYTNHFIPRWENIQYDNIDFMCYSIYWEEFTVGLKNRMFYSELLEQIYTGQFKTLK